MGKSNKKSSFTLQSEKHYGVARILSKRGVCSRQEAEKACHEGRVTLEGYTVLDPETKATIHSNICIDQKIALQESPVYLAFYKPRGVITTANDEQERTTVLDFFKDFKHISPVGRLDAASEGLLLLTNDTHFANCILDPKTHLDKTYHVQVEGILSANELSVLETGFFVPPRIFGKKEEFMRAKSAKLIRQGEKNCWIEVVLNEGKNREIRRMLKHLGHSTMRLIRIKIGPYELGDLKPGSYRLLPLPVK